MKYTRGSTARMTKQARRGKTFWLGFGPLAACSGLVCVVSACAGPDRPKDSVEAYSWWTHTSERQAFDDVLAIFNASHPNANALNEVTASNADDVRDTVTARLLAGAPPSTFQANIGADLLRWTIVDTADESIPSSSRLVGLSSLFDRDGLFGNTPAPLLNELRAGPGQDVYAVPVDIHRLNLLYYNKQSLDAFRQRNQGQSFLDPSVLCPPDLESRLANPQARLDVKIALGKKDAFALVLFAFESVLPAVAGPKMYDDVFRGRATGDWATPVRAALRCTQYLSRSFLGNNADQDWADALARVQKGTADFCVMGDWSNGELKNSSDPDAVAALPFPGSETTFVFTSDTFPLPLNATHPADSEALLDTIASVTAQLAFSRDKGSIPARSDADVSALGSPAVQTQADFMAKGVSKVLATSGLFPPYYPSQQLNAALSAMTDPGASEAQVDAVLQLLADTESLLARWQARLLSEPVGTP